MMNKKELLSILPEEEQQKFKVAIDRGYLEDYSKDWKYTFIGAFLTKNPRRTNILDDLTYELDHFPTWSDLTDRNLKEWKEAITRHMCASSRKTIFASIKAIINDFKNEVDIPTTRYCEILKSKSEPSQAVFLNEREIERFSQYKPTNDTQRYAKKIFMIQCLTGARFSDAEKMTKENIIDNVLTYVSQKTKVKTSMPVHRLLPEYLEDTFQKRIFLDEFNDIIRRICKKCNVNESVTVFRRGKETTEQKYKFVSSHTARRSFATNLFLRGADILTISKLMGHTSVNNTQRYIVGYKQLDQKVLGFFS